MSGLGQDDKRSVIGVSKWLGECRKRGCFQPSFVASFLSLAEIFISARAYVAADPGMRLLLLCLQPADNEAVALSESLQMRSGDFLDSFQPFRGVRFRPEFDSFCPRNQKAASHGEENAFPVRFDAYLGFVSKVGYQLFAVASCGFGGNNGGGCVQSRH
jgi:hypothetical protein